MYLSKISIICTLWYELLNDLDAKSDFDKKYVTKKPVKWNHSYLKYALENTLYLEKVPFVQTDCVNGMSAETT